MARSPHGPHVRMRHDVERPAGELVLVRGDIHKAHLVIVVFPWSQYSVSLALRFVTVHAVSFEIVRALPV